MGPSVKSKVDSNMTCRCIGYQHWHTQGVNPCRARIQQDGVLALKRGQATDPRADHNCNSGRIYT